MNQLKYVLSNVRPYGEAAVDVVIEDGVIVAIDPAESIANIEKIDCRNLILLPGFVDLHCHLREPGKEDSETVLTASRAAAKGGYTAVFAMPNTNPVADNAGVVEQVKRLGEDTGLVDVFPIGAVTKNQAGSELAELGAMAESRAKVRIFSDDGNCVSDPLLMRRALEYVKVFNGVIAQHAQDPGLTQNAQMNESELSAKLGLRGWPAVAEESIIARDCLLAEHVESRYHVLHITTARGAQIIADAKSRGIQVTAEVTPHHLLLTQEMVKNYDPIFKVNPPLRTQDDVLALQDALASGIIDTVGTDHAPHSDEYKNCEWDQAAFGMLGLETAFSILVKTMIQTNKLNWRQLADRMSVKPAEIAGISDHGRSIEVGAPANLVLIDPDKNWTVTVEQIESKSKNSPYLNMELPGKIVHTIFKGNFSLKDGQVTK